MKIQKLKKFFFLCLFISLFLFNMQCYAEEEYDTIIVDNNTVDVEPMELDLGDYQVVMQIGEKQLLDVTVLPEEATNQECTYSSSNMEVATINGMGRIIAVGEGKTEIKVSCGNISQSFELTVNEANESEILVTALDLGACPKEIVLGSSEIIEVSVIPAEVEDVKLKYESNHPEVASINELGRLEGKSIGKAQITVSCGNVKGTFDISVVEDESNKIVPVTEIEIGDYEKELEIDELMNISATVLPAEATDSIITYKSSNPEIATVMSTGEVKGIAKGNVIIYVTAGAVTKEVSLSIIEPTRAINLNSEYLVMKLGDTFQIEAKVVPENAENNITYKAVDTKVATVSANGLITAVTYGNTSIIVANGELQAAVTVIVTEESIISDNQGAADQPKDQLANNFTEDVTVGECSVISTEMLKYFYHNKNILTIQGEKYNIYIDGKDIVNYKNEFYTDISLKKDNKGISFVVNNEEQLCGKITIDLREVVTTEKYLYLYNQEKGKYEKLAVDDIKLLSIDTEGKYLLATERISGFEVNKIWIVVGAIIIIGSIGTYIVIKKKYWFW